MAKKLCAITRYRYLQSCMYTDTHTGQFPHSPKMEPGTPTQSRLIDGSAPTHRPPVKNIPPLEIPQLPFDYPFL